MYKKAPFQTYPSATMLLRTGTVLITFLLFSALLGGCASSVSSVGRIQRHGHILSAEEIASVNKGMSKNEVQATLGTPDTQSTMDGSVFYYMSHKTRTISLFKPTTIERSVVAVYFTKNENVRKIAKYGMKDGRLFDYISRTTPSHGGDYTFLQQMFGNLGKGPKLSL